MASDPPAPKTHFAIMPAKAKGTLADYDAGNLPPPQLPTEAPPVMTRRDKERVRRRQPNPPKQTEPDTSDIPEQGEEFFKNATLKQPAVTVSYVNDGTSPYERVLADLLFKRTQIETAIKALKELYE